MNKLPLTLLRKLTERNNKKHYSLDLSNPWQCFCNILLYAKQSPEGLDKDGSLTESLLAT